HWRSCHKDGARQCFNNLAEMTTTMPNGRECDVLVVGGGPPRSTLSAFLPPKNKNVGVFGKKNFSRLHNVGSLLPVNFPAFEPVGNYRRCSPHWRLQARRRACFRRA